jgi:hypothetical protein
VEGGLLSFEAPAAEAGREHRDNNPIATGTALESIEASEFLFVAASKDHKHHRLAIVFIITVTSLRGCWENPMVKYRCGFGFFLQILARRRVACQ